MRHVWCISDLHIADKGPRDKFGADCEAALIRLLEDFAAVPSSGRTLICNGDTFDFLKIDVALPEPQRGRERMQRALVAYDSLFTAFREFIAAGNSVFMIVGNHDLYFDDPRFGQAMVQRIARSDHGPGFGIVQEFFDPDLRLYIEHGCQFDTDNDYGENGALPFGSQMVEDVINKWELRELDGTKPFFLIDNIRPYNFLAPYMAALIKRDPALRVFRDEFLEDTAKLMEHSHGSFARRFKGMLLDGMVHLTKDHPLGDVLIEGFVKYGSKVDYTKYQHAARAKLAEKSDHYWRPGHGPRHIIFGHTHYLDEQKLAEDDDGPMYYHNTGTWLENVFLADDGTIALRDRFCPVLRFEQDGGVVRFDTYDALHRRPIDVPAVLKYYREHHIEI